MKKKLRKRVIGALTPEQAEHFRKSRAEAEAELESTRAASRKRLRESAEMTEPVQIGEIVEAIRAERLRRGLQANTVAERLKMDAGNFARLESGQGNPTLETVSRLADAVGVELLVSLKAKVS